MKDPNTHKVIKFPNKMRQGIHKTKQDLEIEQALETYSYALQEESMRLTKMTWAEAKAIQKYMQELREKLTYYEK